MNTWKQLKNSTLYQLLLYYLNENFRIKVHLYKSMNIIVYFKCILLKCSDWNIIVAVKAWDPQKKDRASVVERKSCRQKKKPKNEFVLVWNLAVWSFDGNFV